MSVEAPRLSLGELICQCWLHVEIFDPVEELLGLVGLALALGHVVGLRVIPILVNRRSGLDLAVDVEQAALWRVGFLAATVKFGGGRLLLAAVVFAVLALTRLLPDAT